MLIFKLIQWESLQIAYKVYSYLTAGLISFGLLGYSKLAQSTGGKILKREIKLFQNALLFILLRLIFKRGFAMLSS